MKYLNLSFLLIFVLFISCSKEEQWDCTKSTGKIVKETRLYTGDFDIQLEDDIQLVFKANLGDTVIVEAGKNLLPKIRTEIVNGKMYLLNDNKCNWVRSFNKNVKVYIDIKKPSTLIVLGFGGVTSDSNLVKDKISINNNSNSDVNLSLISKYIWIMNEKNGNVNISGTVEEAYAAMYQYGQLNCNDLQTKKFQVDLYGHGDVHLNVSDYLIANIFADGVVYCQGTPKTEINNAGNGRLVQN